MKYRLVFALALTLAGSATGLGQQVPADPPADPPPVTFRVEVNYVEVDAVVTDAQGNLVTDLTADDFEVLEDGRPQEVTAFSHVDLPIARPEQPLFAAGPIEPDVRSNAQTDGRLYLIVLDDLHTSFTSTPRVKTALTQFIDRHFGANDLAAVVFTSGRGQDGQEFTSSRRLLTAAIDRFSGRNLPSATLERFAGGGGRCGPLPARIGGGAGSSDPCEAERGFNARTALDGVRRLAEFMAGVRGRRKAMLLISEGISYDTEDVFSNRSASAIIDEMRDAIAAATRSNMSIYPIDPRGLAGVEDAAIGGVSLGAGNDSPARGLLSELQWSQQSLRTLAAETGGFATINRNDFSDAFARIVRENSQYYVLGYYPANERRDGRYRRIEVRVRRPGLQVRSRRGYVAPRGRAPETPRAADGGTPALAAATEAMASPIPIGGIPMTVAAAPFKGADGNASVAMAIELRADRFRFTAGNGTSDARAEVTFSAVDYDGKPRDNGRHALELTLKPDTLARAKEHGVRLVTSSNLPPGRYQLRVAAGEDGGRSGSVIYDLEIPDFYRAPLTMSGIAITAASARQAPTALPRNPLADFLPGPLTATREFTRGDELALFAEFYENAPDAPPHRLDITTTLRAEGGRVVTESRDERSSTELQGSQGGYGVTVRLPLKDVEPGLYVLRIEGRTRLGDRDHSVGRDVQIRIR